MASRLSDPPPYDTEARKWWGLALERHEQIWQLQCELVEARESSQMTNRGMWLVFGMVVQSVMAWIVSHYGPQLWT